MQSLVKIVLLQLIGLVLFAEAYDVLDRPRWGIVKVQPPKEKQNYPLDTNTESLYAPNNNYQLVTSANEELNRPRWGTVKVQPPKQRELAVNAAPLYTHNNNYAQPKQTELLYTPNNVYEPTLPYDRVQIPSTQYNTDPYHSFNDYSNLYNQFYNYIQKHGNIPPQSMVSSSENYNEKEYDNQGFIEKKKNRKGLFSSWFA